MLRPDPGHTSRRVRSAAFFHIALVGTDLASVMQGRDAVKQERRRVDLAPPGDRAFFARSIAISSVCHRVRVPARSPSPVSANPPTMPRCICWRGRQYRLTDGERADLTQVVEGHTGPHDDDAARPRTNGLEDR